jgi:molecular chaperone GrpE
VKVSVEKTASHNPGAKIVTVQENDNEHTTENAEEEVLTEAVAPEGEPVSDDPLEVFKTELQTAQLAAEEARQSMLRMQADMDNLRKRLVREHEKARRRTLERFMNDLLPVRDSLERGLEAAEDPAASVEALKEGKQLIMKMLTKVMGDHGLQTIDPMGESFNPEKHEAMTMMVSDQHDENTVIDVIEKGYQLNDRLIRPAKVVVSRKP